MAKKVEETHNIYGESHDKRFAWLPEGFEEVFKNRTDVEEEFIEMQRSNFIDDLKKDVIEELADDEWLARCEFPVGMNNEGEFYS